MAKKEINKSIVESRKKKAKAAAPTKEKIVKKKSPTVRKKKVEDIPAEEPKGIVQEAGVDAPADLRGRKRAGRPTDAERSKQEFRDEKIALLCADWIDDIRKERENIPITAKIKALPNFIKLLVREDDVDDESDVTLVLLADKYLGLQKQFHEAEEQSRKEIQSAVEPKKPENDK